jgi:hypothetical protein
MTMSDASKFLINKRSQFREGSIVPVTPARQKVGHFLLRNRGRIHNRFSQPISPEKLLHVESFSKKNLDSDDHFDRPFSFMAVKGKLRNQKKEITPTAIRASKKITTSYLTKEQQ